MSSRSITFCAALAASALLAGCETMPNLGNITSMNLGGGTNNATTGAAAGEGAANASSELERCTSPLGTLSLVENQQATWYAVLRDQYRLPPTSNLLRLMVQQSNCFVVVERSAAGMRAIERERELAETGNTRSGSNLGRGQMVASDYALSPEIMFSNNNASGLGGTVAALIGSQNPMLGRAAGGLRTKEATAMLTLVDNRSGVQVAVSEGSASKTDFNISALVRGSSVGASGGSYTNTEQGKVIAAAFADAYNNMVRAARQYRPQRVQGQGLGGGGRLSVDGANKPSSATRPPPPQ